MMEAMKRTCFWDLNILAVKMALSLSGGLMSMNIIMYTYIMHGYSHFPYVIKW
jgi:hypothetical protein